MLVLLKSLWRDSTGFVLSSELILIATIVILSMIVGLSEVSLAINAELNDVANGFGAVNQSWSGNGSQSGMPGNTNPTNIPEIGGTPSMPEQ